VSVLDEPPGGVPPREQRPDPPSTSPAGEALTQLALTTFRLNARLMDAAEMMAAEGGMTAALWQVLGGVLDQPRTLPEIGRLMGMSRQGVRRVAGLLVDRGLAEYRPNPAHRRAQLLACTEAGYWAIRRIAVVQHPWADRIGSQIAPDDLRQAYATLHRLIVVLEDDQPPEGFTHSRSVPVRLPPTRRDGA
jgi:DNA-binding MarR family transcriptional regulator